MRTTLDSAHEQEAVSPFKAGRRSPAYVSLHPAVLVSFGVVGVAHVAALWFSLYRLVTLSLVLAIVVACVARRASAAPFGKTWVPLVQLALVYVYALASTLWSPSPDALRDAVYMSIAVAPAVMFGVAVSRRYEGVQIAQGFGLLLLPFAVQAVVGILEGSDPMLVGQFTMRTVLANAICVAMPLLAGAWVVTRRARFLVYGAIALLLAMSIGSRSAILFAVPAAAVSMYLADKRIARRVGLALALPVIAALLFIGPATLERFSSESTSLRIDYLSLIEELKRPVEERVDIERRVTTLTAIETFVQHPVLGGGYGSVLQANVDEYGMEVVAHGLLGTLAELGLAGMGLLTFVLWRVLMQTKSALKDPLRRDPMLIHFLVSFCAVLLFGLFHQTLESVFFGLITGVLIGSSSAARGRPRKVMRSGLETRSAD